MAGTRMRKLPGLDGAQVAQQPAPAAPSAPTGAGSTNGAPPAVPTPETPPEPVSEFSRLLDRNIGQQSGYSIEGSVKPRPVPELDKQSVGMDLPRFVWNAITLHSGQTHIPKQDVVLRAILRDPELREALAITHRLASQ